MGLEDARRAVGDIGADALIFVTPEYDFFPPASVVNAVQYLLHDQVAPYLPQPA